MDIDDNLSADLLDGQVDNSRFLDVHGGATGAVENLGDAVDSIHPGLFHFRSDSIVILRRFLIQAVFLGAARTLRLIIAKVAYPNWNIFFPLL